MKNARKALEQFVADANEITAESRALVRAVRHDDEDPKMAFSDLYVLLEEMRRVKSQASSLTVPTALKGAKDKVVSDMGVACDLIVVRMTDVQQGAFS